MNSPALTFSYFSSGSWSDDVSIQSLGFTGATFMVRSRAPSLFNLTLGGADPAAGIPYPFRTPVRIYAQLAGLNSGDKTIIFQGRVRDYEGTAATRRGATLVLADPWDDLEHITFQHFWNVSDGMGGSMTQYSARLFLFEDISTGPEGDWVYLNAHDQLVQIIDYAQDQCGALLQAGTIDPSWTLPVQQVKGITCAQGILEVLRAMPDAVTFFDYTTSPPTLHIRQRANCSSITLPWAETDDNGTRHESSRIRPRYDLICPQVVVQYLQINTIDGAPEEQFVSDVYPPDSTGEVIGAIIAPIDLRGGSVKHVFGEVTAVACDPTSNAFWKAHKPDLNDTTISSLAITNTAINDASPFCLTIVDTATGDPVSLSDFPNELKQGQVASWMKAGSTNIVAKEVTISGFLSYNAKDQAAIVTAHEIVNHPVSVRIKLTNSATGTVGYTDIASLTEGDPTILYLAYYIWCSINNVPLNEVDGVDIPPMSTPSIDDPSNLQWEGTHTVTEQLVYQIIGPGNLLNLNGPGVNTDWESMAAAIYETEIDFFHGKTDIRFGPHLHLTAQQFFELLTAWRNRIPLENPAVRNTGAPASGDTVTLGTDTQKENTNHSALPSYNSFSAMTIPVAGVQTAAQLQPAVNDGQVMIIKYASDGTEDDSSLTIRIAQGDLDASDIEDFPTDGKPICALRKWAGCDIFGNAVTAYFLSTAPNSV